MAAQGSSFDVTQLTTEQTTYLLDLAEQFHEVNTRPVESRPCAAKGVVLFRRGQHQDQNLF